MIKGLVSTFTLLLMLTGCLPEEGVRTQVTNEVGTTNSPTDNNATTPDSSQNNVAQEDAYWFSGGGNSQTLTINFDNTNPHYIFGGDVDSYLKSTDGIKTYNVVNGVSTPVYNYTYEDTFCMQVTFVSTFSQTPNEMRVLAIPASALQISTGVRTRYFRANLSSSAGNDFCNKTVDNQNGTFTAPPASLVYRSNDICPTCNGVISSSSVKILKYNPNTAFLEAVDDGLVKASELTLRIDMNGQTSTGTNTCTDSECNAEGFDCCVNGQCVNEAGLILSGVSSDPAGFAVAENEKANDLNWYLNYPQFYYSCLEAPPNDDDNNPIDPTDPDGDAQARLEALYNDYLCVEQLREFAIESPYTKDYIDSTLPVSQGSYTQCSFLTGDEMQYQTVLKRMYNECGCSEDDDLSIMVDSCPAYYYTATFVQDSSGNDTDIVKSVSCYTPPVDSGPVPFEDRDVIVNARTAPHRFFNEDNEEYSLLEALPDGVSTVQEGDEFNYLDDEKLFPVNGSFNMNSILGNINVNLTEARPAKVIDIEFDKVYYFAAIDGYYTPCPNCSKDSWFANFTAFPSTTQGHGVRASGYTTKRSEWGTNTSLANYEDLIFGRACWIPPTMVPFSHSSIDGDDAQQQRLNRLQTQAALYANGYQRDWYGFNKGALIGSFDGVTWFAIGKSRVARSTSDKLFLAINAPFADLANPNDLTVHVAEYDFISTAAKYDYKDTSEINEVDQNDGGLCQKFHQCDTDTDCITQLGWEYVCANVTQMQTKWPKFEPIGAKELNDDERIGNIVEFLQQGELPPDTESLKRCVYRGAGAPCRVDNENISNYNLRKSLSCAPNFYCASVSSNVFNKEVARFGNSLDAILEPKNHLIGRDANVLGRPKDYIGATNALSANIITTLKENLIEFDDGISNQEGLCVPGKSLPEYISISNSTNTDPNDQQKQKDPQGRTDYISQIAGCNASMHTIMRYSSCPVIDTDGNYLNLKSNFLADQVEINFGLFSQTVDSETATQFYSTRQNACGLENIDQNVTIGQGIDEELMRDGSAFKLIEGRDLSSSDTQIEPILAQNACLRRAGAVCHTDLDCSPGKKHFEILDVINPDLFGNTPERKYWEEYLICGQAQAEPRVVIDDPDSFEAFNEWNMSNNRCCREVGKEITMYSEDTPGLEDETSALRADIYGGVNPNDPRRYSRYMNASPRMSTAPFSDNGAFVAELLDRPTANTENINGLLSSATNITNSNQWITISETAGRTCCGGGWVRKFADGTNDWGINRLNLDVSSFKCLNYKTPLYLTDTPEAYDLKPQDINQDLPYLCVDPSGAQAGCAQYNFDLVSDDDLPELPVLDGEFTTVMEVDSDLSTQGPMGEDGDIPWSENPYSFFGFFQTDTYAPTDGTVLTWNQAFTDVEDDNLARQMLAVRVPSFITFRNDNFNDSSTHLTSPSLLSSIVVEMENPRNDSDEDEHIACVHMTGVNNFDSASGWGGLTSPNEFSNSTWNSTVNANSCTGNEACCFMYNQRTRELRVSYAPEVLCEQVPYSGAGCSGPDYDNGEEDEFYSGKILSLRITFTAAGTLKWENEQLALRPGTNGLDDGDLGIDSMFHHRRSSEPGNAMYYLTKLSRLEYLGVPQMTYEPVFCNDNYQKLVPDLYKPELDNAEFGGDENGILTSYDWMRSSRTFRDPDALGNWQVTGDATGDPDLDPREFYGSDELRVGTMDEVNHPKVFSTHEFKCCLPLGSNVEEGEGSLCCSGYAAEADTGVGVNNTDLTGSDTVYTCKLPIGTDLNVYFNRFISGEGNDVFEASDFDDRTGEVKVSVEIQNKLRELGEAHCDPGDSGGGAGSGGTVISGGAFGDYNPEPVPAITINGASSTVFGIVDSQNDNSDGSATPAGFNQFSNGFRWNHHLYCGESQ